MHTQLMLRHHADLIVFLFWVSAIASCATGTGAGTGANPGIVEYSIVWYRVLRYSIM